MNRRFTLLSLASAAFAATGVTAYAAIDLPLFKNSDFETAQAAGKSILLHIAATWCETCQAQRVVLDKLEKDTAFKDYVIITIDFDTQKDVMRNFKANSRSTLIVFKGKTEMGRMVAITKPAAIKALLEKAL